MKRKPHKGKRLTKRTREKGDLGAFLDGFPDASTLIADLQIEEPSAFDFSQTGKRSPAEDAQVDTRDLVLRRKSAFRSTLDLSKVANAVKQLRFLPKEEESLHAIMGGDFNGWWDLIPAIRNLAERPIREMVITTLGFNHRNIAQLCAMIDAGEAKNVSVVCSTYFKNADPDIYEIAREWLAERGQRICATRNHSKIILIDAGPASYVVESSANLRTCNNLEQFTLTRSRPLYRFHRGWIFNIFKAIA